VSFLCAFFTYQPSPEEQGRWHRFAVTEVIVPPEALPAATDAWPFLYLRRPMIPELSLRGLLVMGGPAFLLLFVFLPQRPGESGRWRGCAPMFFLGAGFLLVETRAVVQLALFCGNTWTVNAVVIGGVLVMILAANGLVRFVRLQRLGPAYAGLLASLVLGSLVPLDVFLGLNRVLQVACACLLLFTPLLFAGVIFAVSLGRSAEPDQALGANLAGAMAGGWAEYSSLLLGFQYLTVVAVAFYVLSAVLRPVELLRKAEHP
jgi:hypothetical protein